MPNRKAVKNRYAGRKSTAGPTRPNTWRYGRVEPTAKAGLYLLKLRSRVDVCQVVYLPREDNPDATYLAVVCRGLTREFKHWSDLHDLVRDEVVMYYGPVQPYNDNTNPNLPGG